MLVVVAVVIAIVVKFVGVKWIDKVMPAVVIGPTVAIIGLSLSGNAIKDAVSGVFDSNASAYIMNTNAILCLICALVTFGVTIVCSVYGKKFLRMIPFIIGILSMFVIAVVVGKIFHYSWQLCCGMACSCLFGFPGTYVVSTEVAKTIATTEDEEQMILDNILPKMLVAGFICLTITSVLITGVFVNYFVA